MALFTDPQRSVDQYRTGVCDRCGGKSSVRTVRSKTRSCRECGGSGKRALCDGTGWSDWRKTNKGGGGKELGLTQL